MPTSAVARLLELTTCQKNASIMGLSSVCSWTGAAGVTGNRDGQSFRSRRPGAWLTDSPAHDSIHLPSENIDREGANTYKLAVLKSEGSYREIDALVDQRRMANET